MRCKELGPMTSISMAPSSNYVEVTHKAKQQFFASDVDKEGYEYFLADPQGSKLPDTINGNPWNLSEYIHLHGLYPSKTKIYCVQVSYMYVATAGILDIVVTHHGTFSNLSMHV